MSNSVETEVMQTTAVEAISKAEISEAIATARRFPRSLSQVKQAMMSFATLDQETAEACFYTLPRGGKTIQGPSVRLAEIAVSSYGNLRAGSRILQTVTTGDNPHVVIQAVAMDLEKNVSVSIEKRRRITKKKSKESIDEDDINLAANAGSAIAFRDAVFKVIPLALIKPVFEAAKKVAIGDARTLNDRRAKAFETFAKMGVPKEKVLAVLQKKAVEDVGLEDLETLLGLHNAIKEGEVTLDEAFPAPTSVKAPDFGPAQARTTTTPPPKTTEKPVNQAKQPQTPEPKPSGVPQDEPEDGGLGPVTPDDQKAQPAQEPAAGDPLSKTVTPQESDPQQQPTDPGPFKPNTAETDELQSVRLLLHEAGLTEARLMDFCRAKKMSRDGQKLSELSTAKLKTLISSWPNILPEIKT